MLGAIIGDIVGSRYEFNNTTDPQFPLFSDGCGVTDDSICTIAVADAILRKAKYGESLYAWCRRYPHPMGGYGGSFARWLRQDHVGEPYGSYGNGAAMRISAVGAAFDTDREVIRHAFAATHVTHSHVEGIIGATSVALLISRLKRDKAAALANDDLERIAFEYYGTRWEENLPPRGHFDETCQGCVPLAFHIVKHSTSFEDAIRQAVLYGGDTDTVGAIVGGIAEERFGIGEHIVREASRFVPAEIKAVIREFYQTFYDAQGVQRVAPLFG